MGPALPGMGGHRPSRGTGLSPGSQHSREVCPKAQHPGVPAGLVPETTCMGHTLTINTPDVRFGIASDLTGELHLLLLRIQREHDVTRLLDENRAVQRGVI